MISSATYAAILPPREPTLVPNTLPQLKSFEEARPFFERVVAYCPPDNEKLPYEYFVDGDTSIYFGYVDTMNNKARAFHICKLLRIDRLETRSSVGWSIDEFSLEYRSWFMRLATAEELEKIRKALSPNRVYFWNYPLECAHFFVERHLKAIDKK